MIVLESAIRALVAETLANGSDEPVNVNNVVDPSAHLTDPANADFKPQSKAEFVVAVNDLLSTVPDEQVHSVYSALKHAISLGAKDRSENPQMSKKDQKSATADSKKVEEMVRAAVRSIISEISPKMTYSYGGLEAGEKDDDEEEDDGRKKLNTVSDVGGMPLPDIADKFGMSVAWAHREEKAAKDAMKERMLLHPQIVDDATERYIRYLTSSGEVSDADVDLLKTHPDIVRDMKGFQSMMDDLAEAFAEYLEGTGAIDSKDDVRQDSLSDIYELWEDWYNTL